MRQYMAQAPLGVAHWLCALDWYVSTPREIAIVGAVDDPDTRSLVEVLYDRYLPNKAVAGKATPIESDGFPEIPLLEGRDMVGGRPTAYVCQNYVCQLPVTGPEALAAQLGD